MSLILFLFTFNIFSLYYVSEAARILAVFPVPSISHQVVFRPLTQELARRGHDVTVITTDPAFPQGQTPQNLTEIDIHDISYKIWREKLVSAPKGNKEDLVDEIKLLLDLSLTMLDAQFSTKEVKDLINNENATFDLLLLEACVRTALAFCHKYKVPVIQVSSLGAIYGNFETIGAPIHPILYATNRRKLTNLSMMEKLKELNDYYKIHKIYEQYEELDIAMIRKHFGSDTPSITELRNNVDMLFLNVNPVFEGIRPVPPAVVYMGGLHQKPQKELPQELKKLLDSSQNGVIYFSFGTNVDTSLLPQEKILVIVKVLSQLPYEVLWKWDADELPGRTENIKISKWWPQSDLLRHPKIKLFITQGGLQSTDEAITAGVPLIGIPMMGDQWYNVERYVYHKIGVKIEMESLTEENLGNAITTIIGDESYRQNILRLGKLMRDEPMRPLDRAVWWTEYVLRHGGARQLRAPAANMSWAQYLELELVLTVLIVLLITTSVLAFTIYLLIKRILALYKERRVEMKVKSS